jgi:selenocysteine lyase/cysteine desulfurase
MPGDESQLGDLDNYVVHGGARRFEVGHANFAGIYALNAGLSLLEEVGGEAIEAHVRQLGASLTAQLLEHSYRVVTPSEHGAGIVSVAVDDPDSVAEKLRERGVVTASRRGFLRASMHLYNNQADIDTFVHELRRVSVPHTN